MDSIPEVRKRIKRQFRKCILDVSFVKWDDKKLISKIVTIKPKGIILSGSTSRILNENSPFVPAKLFELDIPILGICYGYQTIITHFVGKSGLRSHENLFHKKDNIVFRKPLELPELKYQLSHHDNVVKIPKDWKEIEIDGFVKHNKKDIAGCYEPNKKLMGIIFHPEKNKKTGRLFFEKWQEFITK